MSVNKPVQLGLCCLNITLRDQKDPVLCSRTMIVRTIKTKGIDFLKERVMKNVNDLFKMIEWNEQNGIKVFRISSNLFPQISNPDPTVPKYNIDFARDALKKAGDLAKKYNQRLTFHPGQFNVIGSPKEHCFRNQRGNV